MRAYFIGNMYLSSIQQGIQAGHCAVEMFTKYNPGFSADPDTEFLQLDDWARDHKTMVLLNGGFSSALHEFYEFLQSDLNPYPFAKFHEGEDALDGALTCVGIVLPEKIYKGAAKLRGKLEPHDYGRWVHENVLRIEVEGKLGEYAFTSFETELMKRLNCMRLAQ